MTVELDVRGLACPEPIIRLKHEIERIDRGTIRMIIDSDATLQNIRRFAENNSLAIEVKEGDGVWTVSVTKGGAADGAAMSDKGIVCTSDAPQTVSAPTVFMVRDMIGDENPELGKLLIRAFIKTLLDISPRPASVVLMHGGVRLACEGSVHIEPLRTLANEGTDILVCGTCLDFLGLKADLRVGRASNMYEIVETLARSTRVIRP